MKTFTYLLIACICSTQILLNAEEAETKTEKVNIEQLSETYGNFLGRTLKGPGIEFDIESVIRGIRAGAKGDPAPLTEEQYKEMISVLQQSLVQEMSTQNLKDADVFMEKNKTSEDIVIIEPGLVHYMVLQEGEGLSVKEDDTPVLHYTGKLLDGSVFGSSKNSGQPATISLEQTVPGFRKGVIGMKEGETRRIFIHPKEGYGDSTSFFEPNALLIFDIELIKANAPAEEEEDEKENSTEE